MADNPEGDTSSDEDSLLRSPFPGNAPDPDWYPSVMRHSDPDNLMACPICYYRFSHREDARNTPLVGTCAHSVCRKCIEKLAEEKEEDEVECKFKRKLFFHGLHIMRHTYHLVPVAAVIPATGPLCRDGNTSAFNAKQVKINHGLVNMILGCLRAEREWCARHKEAYYIPPNNHPQVIKVRKAFPNKKGVSIDFIGEARMDQDLAGGIHFHVVYEDGDDETVGFEELQVMAKEYVLKSKLNTDPPKRKRAHRQVRTEAS